MSFLRNATESKRDRDWEATKKMEEWVWHHRTFYGSSRCCTACRICNSSHIILTHYTRLSSSLTSSNFAAITDDDDDSCGECRCESPSLPMSCFPSSSPKSFLSTFRFFLFLFLSRFLPPASSSMSAAVLGSVVRNALVFRTWGRFNKNILPWDSA